MLSKGLTLEDIPGGRKRSEISLRHAKTKTGQTCGTNFPGKSGVEDAPCSPFIKHVADKDDTQEKSCSSLHVQDTRTGPSEGIRSVCNRILSVPDLAGLHHYEMSRKKPPPVKSSAQAHSKGALEAMSTDGNLSHHFLRNVTPMRMVQSWNTSDERVTQEVGSIKNTSSQGRKKIASVCTPISRRRISYSQSSLYATSGAVSERKIVIGRPSSSRSYYDEIDAMQEYNTQVGFTTSPDEASIQSSDSNEGPFQFKLSCDGRVSTPRHDPSVSAAFRPRMSMESSPFARLESLRSSPSAAVTSIHQASVSDALSHRSSGSSERLPGCIFDYEDPWGAIGTIMGLPQSKPKIMTLEEELAILGATSFCPGATVSNNAIREETLIENYGDERTSSTLFGSDDVPKYEYESSKFSYVHWGETSVEMEDDECFDENEYSGNLLSGNSWLDSDYKDIFSSDRDYAIFGGFPRVDEACDESYEPHSSSLISQTLNVDREPLGSLAYFTEDVSPNSNFPTHKSPPLSAANPIGDVGDYRGTLSNNNVERGEPNVRREQDALSGTATLPTIRDPANDIYYGPCLFTDGPNIQSA
ncbi:hypothetical protein AX15_003347 [Amanita polypyramis BW_CC]|nr:hypothetical protein AX15_003347 [Amanita polypyramis BW_CC]